MFKKSTHYRVVYKNARVTGDTGVDIIKPWYKTRLTEDDLKGLRSFIATRSDINCSVDELVIINIYRIGKGHEKRSWLFKEDVIQ